MAENENRKRSVPWTAIWLPVLLLIGYPLSVGPVVAIGENLVPYSWLRGAYAPLLWLSRRNGWFKDALDGYIEFWQKLLWMIFD